MTEVVGDVKFIVLPVITSVIMMRYSDITPLMSLEGGGDQVISMEVELTEESWTLCGGLDGAAKGYTHS